MKKSLVTLVLVLLCIAGNLSAVQLEGSGRFNLKDAPPITQLTAAQRQAELAARTQAMADLQASFVERLDRSITPQQTAAIKTSMDAATSNMVGCRK